MESSTSAASALFRGISNTFDSPFARRFSTATLHSIIQPGDASARALLEGFRRITFDSNNNLTDWLSSYWPALCRNKTAYTTDTLRQIAEDNQLDWRNSRSPTPGSVTPTTVMTSTDPSPGAANRRGSVLITPGVSMTRSRSSAASNAGSRKTGNRSRNDSIRATGGR